MSQLFLLKNDANGNFFHQHHLLYNLCGVVGSKVGGAIANGIGAVAGAIVDGAVGIVKAGKEVIKSVASGIWNGVKTVGSAVVSGLSSVASGIGNFIGRLFG